MSKSIENYSKASRRQKGPLLITEESLSRLGNILSEEFDELDITINCSDNVSHSYSSIESLLSYQNPKSSKIEEILIECYHSEIGKKWTRIRISSLKYIEGFEYDVKISSRSVYDVRDKIEKVIEGTIPVYHFFRFINLVNVFAVLSFILLFVLVCFLLTGEADYSGRTIDSDFWKREILSAILGVVFFAFFLLLEKINTFLFKRTFFLIGDEKERYNFIKKIRWSLILPLIMGIVISVI